MSHPEIIFTLVEDGETPGIAFSAEAYARMLRSLLPPGKLWWLEPDSMLYALLLACGDELARVDARAKDILRESDPRTADELLTEFEDELNLSHDGTDADRRLRIVAALTKRPRYRPVDFQNALAPYLGQDPEDVVVIELTNAEAISTGDEREVFHFFVMAPPGADIPGAQAVLDSMKPSHTVGQVIATTGFVCDDPDSLCNRDILGA